MINLFEKTKNYSIRTKIVYCSEYSFSCCNIEPFDQIVSIKPYGCWYSWGPVWFEFLMRINTKWGRKKIKNYFSAHKIQIDYSKILKIRKNKDFIEFTKEYQIPCKSIKKYTGIGEMEDYNDYEYPCVIDWRKVAKKYNGIDITYSNWADEKFFWYNGWDVSSGVIWNFKSIKSASKI